MFRMWFALGLMGCGGAGEYRGTLVNGMDSSPLGSVRIVAKASPAPPDLTCQVRETTTTADGNFVLENLCRDQNYVMSIPEPTLQMSGNTVVAGVEAMEPTSHQAWRSPDGQGIYRLQGDSVVALPTFSDVAVDEAMDGTAVRYPDMKPTGKVLTISEGEHLVLAGKRTIQRMQFFPLVSHEGRVQLKGDTIRDHVFIGVAFDDSGKPTTTEATFDDSKVTEVLIRGEGMRFIAHDAVAPGRYAVLGDTDTRVTVLDFGSSQTAAK